MKIIVWIMIFMEICFACSGDCASCHYKLNYQHDIRHSPMLECKSCHTDEKMAKIDMGKVCGQDCFACHDVNKLNDPNLASSHKIINNCISCHQTLHKNSQTTNKSIFLRTLKSDFFEKK
ncbi:hypothetical protein [Helicobacter sp. 11S03491-1]|uniref:cytochrome c3 family protein n=1 Tax=Helicobacter sp. 11S03491-1 TaxID=1476196 RepID=UPI002151E985|nr:hypothetical protein [Helicobacter sp. 11S03491-1]